MDPTVTGAAIGLGGAVIGAVGTYLATARNTSKTIESEREKRVWERRADAYLEAVAALEYLQVTRGTVADWNPPMLEDFLRTHNTPDWEMLDARIQTFASEPVWERWQAVIKAYKVLPALHLQAPLPEPPHMERIAEAQVTGAAFVDLIRCELQRSERQQTLSQRRSSQDHPQRLKRELEAIAIFDDQSRSG